MVVRAERVLFITTSVGEVGDTRRRTGLWYVLPFPISCTALCKYSPWIPVYLKCSCKSLLGVLVLPKKLILCLVYGGETFLLVNKGLVELFWLEIGAVRLVNAFEVQAWEPGRAILLVSEEGVHRRGGIHEGRQCSH